jgi:DNA-binding transcriptional MerR regulator/methylmalonyl-CoA mutase cobalamin-binding subunit
MLSIGALSNVTGIPVETIRTWERRYGFPRAERKPSGHRRYPISTVSRVRRIAQAIAAGYRPADVVPASEKALDALLATIPLDVEALPQSRTSHPRALGQSSEGEQTQHLRAVSDFDATRLQRILDMEWARLGPVEFLERRAAPLLRRIGEAWASGELDVRHEHFASACLGDFLRTVRTPLDDRARGPVMALATLPGERHGLGLQMAAVVLALAGWRTLIIGVDTPVSQIAALAKEVPVAAVGISVVRPHRAAGGDTLPALRRRLRREIALIVGGAGAPSRSAGRGISVLRDLPALERWTRSRPGE